MERETLVSKGKHICTIDIMNQLYQGTVGGTEDIYLLDGKYYSVRTYKNQLEYLGENSTDEIGTIEDIRNNPMIIHIDGYRAIFGDDETEQMLERL